MRDRVGTKFISREEDRSKSLKKKSESNLSILDIISITLSSNSGRRSRMRIVCEVSWLRHRIPMQHSKAPGFEKAKVLLFQFT